MNLIAPEADLAARWKAFAQWLTGEHPQQAALLESFSPQRNFGARPFEVIAGTPCERYGCRVTFEREPGYDQWPERFLMDDPAVEAPDWIGLRVSPAGRHALKNYRRLEMIPMECARLICEWPGFMPVMISQFGTSREVYLRFLGEVSWPRFVAHCTRSMGHASCAFHPQPRTCPGAFCASFRWDGAVLASVSVFADQRALPDDVSISKAWVQGMSEADREVYLRALDAVRSLGTRGTDSWHAMLAWTMERGGDWHRAVSLRVRPAEPVFYA